MRGERGGWEEGREEGAGIKRMRINPRAFETGLIRGLINILWV